MERLGWGEILIGLARNGRRDTQSDTNGGFTGRGGGLTINTGKQPTPLAPRPPS